MTTLRIALRRTNAGWHEYLAGWKPWRSGLLYLALLLGPAGITAVILYEHHLSATLPAGQVYHRLQDISVFCEAIGPWLLMAAAGVFLGKAALLRNATYLVVGVMAACLMYREFHWTHASKVLIYPLLGLCLAWAVLWWKKLDRPASNPWLSLFLFAALATYGLAQFVEKRLFEFLPNEEMLHSQFEEVTEVIAHSLLLISALLSCWRPRSADNDA